MKVSLYEDGDTRLGHEGARGLELVEDIRQAVEGKKHVCAYVALTL